MCSRSAGEGEENGGKHLDVGSEVVERGVKVERYEKKANCLDAARPWEPLPSLYTCSSCIYLHGIICPQSGQARRCSLPSAMKVVPLKHLPRRIVSTTGLESRGAGRLSNHPSLAFKTAVVCVYASWLWRKLQLLPCIHPRQMCS